MSLIFQRLRLQLRQHAPLRARAAGPPRVSLQLIGLTSCICRSRSTPVQRQRVHVADAVPAAAGFKVKYCDSLQETSSLFS